MISEDWSKKFEIITFYLLSGIIIVLPFSIQYCSIFIILFCVFTLFKSDLRGRFKAIVKNKFFISSAAFFLFHIVAMLWTTNVANGWFEVEKKLSVLILPLFIGLNNFRRKQINILLLVFCGTILSVVITSLFFTFDNYLKFHDVTYVLSDQFSSVIGIHRGYLSIYILFSLFIVLIFAYRNDFFQNRFSRLIGLACLIILLVGFVFLIYRITFLIFFLTLQCASIYFIVKHKKYSVGIALLIFELSLILFLFQVPKIKSYISELYTDLDKGKSEMNMTGPNQRVVKWKAAIEVIRANPILGVGTGDTDDELYKQYLKEEFFWGIKYHYNSHNQYLQTYAALGLFGLLLLIYLLAISIKTAIVCSDYVALAFLIIIIIVFFTECILSNQKGVVFFSLFTALFNIELSNSRQDILVE